jgi:hypothetical protein
VSITCCSIDSIITHTQKHFFLSLKKRLNKLTGLS